MLVKTPPMGFNTWNTFGHNISDSVIRETADAMVDLGYLDAGYEYLVIDDCWSERDRDPATDKIVPDKNKFPNGMKSVSDYVHSKGLKFGMYSCAGVRTCANFPGSFNHEYLDAKTFAEYGCDFLKYDYCNRPDVMGRHLYYRMGMALKNCGRDILFSACNWGSDNVHEWIRSSGAHMYRSTGDIFDSFQSFSDIALSQLDKFGYSAPGCFNDIDMLTCGMYNKGNVATGGCTTEEYIIEFALWCMLGAPLMLGCDIRNQNEAMHKLLTNRELIRINQDPECRPAFVPSRSSQKDMVLCKYLENDEFALGFFNLTEHKCTMFSYFEDIGITNESGCKVELTDVFTGNKTISSEYHMEFIEGHTCRVYRCKLVH